MSPSTPQTATPGDIRRISIWLIVFGILQAILGFFALTTPLYAGLAVTYMAGIIILINGLIGIFAVSRAPSWGQGIFRFFSSALGVLVGILTIMHPLYGLGFLTIMLAMFFIMSGSDNLVLGYRMKGVDGRGWVIFGGALSILLGVSLLTHWPFSAKWAVGTLLGIHVLMAGWGKLMVGAAARAVTDSE